MQPIRPEELTREEEAIPPFVIEAFNELIRSNSYNRTAVFGVDEAITLISRRMTGLFKRERIMKNGWLAIGSLYQSAGWDVEFNKPYFVFREN